jgi:hypothetical protein
LPTILFHEAAQKLYTEPLHTTLTVGRAFGDMAARHQQTGMRENRPIQADYLEMRVVWNALAAPLLHGTELKMVGEMLPFIESGVSLIPPGSLESDFYDHTFTRQYSGIAIPFLRAMAPWGEAAAEKFLYEIESDSSHWYRSIWESFCEYHPYFCELEDRVDRGFNRTRDPVEAITRLALDSETVYALLEPAQRHFSIWGSDWKKNNQGLFAAAEQLGWAASTKQNLVAKYMGRMMRPKICPFVHARLALSSGGIWALKMLKDGKQDPPGFCPANVMHQSPFQHDRDIVEGLHGQVRQAAGGQHHRLERAYGTSSTAGL